MASFNCRESGIVNSESETMTDLEITKLCAEALGKKCRVAPNAITGEIGLGEDVGLSFLAAYDPLHDDAQAMALLKKFELQIWPGDAEWDVAFANRPHRVADSDLNRAICLAVAKMQVAKAKP